MRVIPLRNKVFLRLEAEQPTLSKGGLHLGDSTSHLKWGIVVSVGEEVRDVKPGMTVLVNTLQGREVSEELLVPEPAIVGYV